MAGRDVVLCGMGVPTFRGTSVRRLEGSAGSCSETLVPNQEFFTMNHARTSDES